MGAEAWYLTAGLVLCVTALAATLIQRLPLSTSLERPRIDIRRIQRSGSQVRIPRDTATCDIHIDATPLTG